MKNKAVLVKYAVLALCSVLLVGLFDGILSLSVFVGALYCANAYLAAGIFLISSFLNGMQGFFVALTQVAVLLFAVLFHKLLKKKMHKWVLVLFFLASNIFYVCYNLQTEFAVFDRLLYSLLGLGFSFVCIYAFNCVFVRGLRYKPALDETMCLCMLLVVLSYAACFVELGQFTLIEFVAPLAILFALFCMSQLSCFVVAVCVGLGSVFAVGDFYLFSCYAIFALTVVCAVNLNKAVAVLSVVVCDVVLKYFFETTGTVVFESLLPVLLAAVVFLLLPNKVLKFASDKLGYGKQSYSGKSVVNKLRLTLAKQLFDLSDVFFSMQTTFKTMVNSALTPEQAEKVLSRQLAQTVCADCEKRQQCWRNNADSTFVTFDELVRVALSRGKVTILDLDTSLTSRCSRINSILSETNNEVKSYLSYYNKSCQIDSSRLLVCEQLYGVSRIMHSLASECKNSISFDTDKEKRLMEELTFYNILTKEAVFMEDGRNVAVMLTIDKKDYDANSVCQIASSVSNCKLTVEKVESISDGNWLTVHLIPQPQYEIAYGFASVAKQGSELSGDTHSFVKVDKGKFLLSVCDGMGSGESAEKSSSTAISLVENFYKAGFDNDIILSSVNKLLTVTGNETFTAVDICVINLHKGLCDFIKLGATHSVCKIGGKTRFVAGSSLPLGVLEEAKPSITKVVLSHNDFVLLYSDGFSDCFDDKNKIAEYVQGNVSTNPQLMADELMKRALDNCGKTPKDDMTLLVARVV